MNNNNIIERIEHAINNNKDSIDLSGFRLKELPKELKNISWLKRLNISFNDLEELPEWLGDLTNIEVLDLRSNKLKRLFKGISNLNKLYSINIRDNCLEDMPVEIRGLKNLQYISVGHNKLTNLPEWFFNIPDINISNNPIVDPPIEVYNKGLQAVLNYFKERANGTEKLYEAKLLIVGEGNAGKTTLMNLIVDQNYNVNPFLPSTKGIEIKTNYFISDDKNYFRVNIWDFGGQEIYHATHQFFLTKRSLYILLSDNRSEDTHFQYWLQTIELLSGNSPLIIVQNERDDRQRDINEGGMKERFTNIQKTYSFNIATDKPKLKSLTSTIHSEIQNLPHIGTELPKIWVNIRKTLENRAKEKSVITETEYFGICKDHGMTEKDRASFLSDYLHDLGVFLHFKDHAILKRWIILKPTWGTEAVYKILDNEKVINNNGYFTKEDLKTIWSESTYADMHDELISLMIRFELCYQIEFTSSYIAAQLLQRLRPKYEWNEKDNLYIRYTYEFMPKGIITRFIVRMHHHINNQKLVWREGVILERAETKAEVIETYGKREIRIRLKGKYKKEFIAIILDHFDQIHASYTNLKVVKQIPCNCKHCKTIKTPFYFDYSKLRKYQSFNRTKITCDESMEDINIASLIDDIFGTTQTSGEKRISIFLSFEEQDKPNKKLFTKHLKLLKSNYGVITLTDKDDTKVGENERLFIFDQLETAEIIIALISPDYLSSDWVYSNELTVALNRSESGQCLLIPVIIRECNWHTTSIGHLKPVQFKNKAILNDTSKTDEALTDAVEQIKSSIDSFIKQYENRNNEEAQNTQYE